jgi:hypothetical protein
MDINVGVLTGEIKSQAHTLIYACILIHAHTNAFMYMYMLTRMLMDIGEEASADGLDES